jgi:maltooligosyltrehalose trehalohydrolase
MLVGALYQRGQGCLFRVFAPEAGRVRLRFVDSDRPDAEFGKRPEGYWELRSESAGPGTLYLIGIDDGPFRPDPASRFQPQGVHGPSQVVDPEAYAWTDSAWSGFALEDAIFYEVHPGTFTPEGTLDAIIARLPHLIGLGVNVLQIMPVAQFPGERNWGYDGAYPYAVQNSYGGPEALKRLVDACHASGVAVVLDVVYNHLGPEGNYLAEFGPYFTDRYRTPWGRAINLDGPWSDQVRDFFIENALFWLREYHLDGLRLDAIHEMYDLSAIHFLAEMERRVSAFSDRSGRRRWLIAESDLNDPRTISSRDAGGHGMQAQWLDDFQHCVDALARGEASAYHRDYAAPAQLARAFRAGFVYAGEYCPSRRRRFGASSAARPPSQFVAFIQNHDQVGNRPWGERFGALTDPETQKLAAGALFLSPYIPLLFMGEEYAEPRSFLFFADYGDQELSEAVRQGRKREFAHLHMQRETPDPTARETFLASKLDWSLPERGPHRIMADFYRELIRLRKALPALARLDRTGMEMTVNGSAFHLIRRAEGRETTSGGEIAAILNFGREPARWPIPGDAGDWELIMDSADAKWGGPGGIRSGETLIAAPRSFSLFRRADRG